jgi:hypothetical protein
MARLGAQGRRLGADEGLRMEGMRVESSGRKRRRETNVEEADSLFERSAKAVREAQITRTGCIHFPMQAHCLLYNSRY